MTSFPTPFVSLSDDNPITHTLNGQPAVSSREIALRFQKKHKEILRDIDRICSMCPESFTERNFAPSEYTDSTGRALPCYLLTRDAFTLLAMGFTGKAALLWKLRYIEAFNALEEIVRKSLSAEVIESRRALLALETGADQARREARAEAAKAALSMGTKQKARLRRVLAYKQRGFTQRETAKVMGVHRREIGYLLKTARVFGLEA
jgi:Rha family phage regulatory protein